MRHIFTTPLTLTLVLGFATTATAADKPRLEVSDPGLPLYELRPLDRRVYVLTLDGQWNQPATKGVAYYVNILFPNGRAYGHRAETGDPRNLNQLRMEVQDGVPVYKVVEDSLFRRGEVRCVIQDYQLARNGLAKGGKFTVVVSSGKSVASATAPEVVSNAFEVTWPLDRPIVTRQPRSRHAEPPPVDAFPLPGDIPEPERIPPPRPIDSDG